MCKKAITSAKVYRIECQMILFACNMNMLLLPISFIRILMTFYDSHGALKSAF